MQIYDQLGFLCAPICQVHLLMACQEKVPFKTPTRVSLASKLDLKENFKYETNNGCFNLGFYHNIQLKWVSVQAEILQYMFFEA